MSTTNKSFIFQFIVALVGIILLTIVITKADWSYFYKVDFTYKITPVLLAAFSAIVLLLFRTVTIFLFLHKPATAKFQDLLLPSSKYQLLSLVTPMHAADILLPFMLRAVTNKGLGYHFIMVYVFRLTDLLVLFVIFALLPHFILELSDFKYNPVLYLVLVLLIIIYIYPFSAFEASTKVLNKLFSYFNRHTDFFKKINIQISIFRDNFSFYDIILIIASVILTWLAFALMYYYIFEMYDFEITFIETLFCVAMVNLASLIPMQTFGGIGLRESTLLLGLIMLGNDVEIGALYAVVVRLTALLFQLTIFSVIFLLFSVNNAQKN